MAYLTIKQHQMGAPCGCALCGRPTTPSGGPQLALGSDDHVVCRDCGKRHAPALSALLDLAQTAERVGRIGKHTLVPPLNALLDLARAAEDYSSTAFRRQAA